MLFRYKVKGNLVRSIAASPLEINAKINVDNGNNEFAIWLEIEII